MQPLVLMFAFVHTVYQKDMAIENTFVQDVWRVEMYEVLKSALDE